MVFSRAEGTDAYEVAVQDRLILPMKEQHNYNTCVREKVEDDIFLVVDAGPTNYGSKRWKPENALSANASNWSSGIALRPETRRVKILERQPGQQDARTG